MGLPSGSVVVVCGQTSTDSVPRSSRLTAASLVEDGPVAAARRGAPGGGQRPQPGPGLPVGGEDVPFGVGQVEAGLGVVHPVRVVTVRLRRVALGVASVAGGYLQGDGAYLFWHVYQVPAVVGPRASSLGADQRASGVEDHRG